MTWLQKLLPPRIKSTPGVSKKSMPEGLWVKCPACEAVLYRTDLEKNLNVCPKCGHHGRLNARERIDQLLDPEARYEIGSEVVPVDSLKFKDTKKYPERLVAALEETGETDALVVMQGSIKSVPLVLAVFEFDFMGGSMGSVVGERFVRGVRVAYENQVCFVCITASGGARMQEGVNSLFRVAKETAVVQELNTEQIASVSLGLERLRAVHDRLALAPACPVVTVTGTNGKGSTCAFIERMLSAGGYRVGLYTSPHLLRYNERVRIAGAQATDAELTAAFAAVEAVRQDIPLTY